MSDIEKDNSIHSPCNIYSTPKSVVIEMMAVRIPSIADRNQSSTKKWIRFVRKPGNFSMKRNFCLEFSLECWGLDLFLRLISNLTYDQRSEIPGESWRTWMFRVSEMQKVWFLSNTRGWSEATHRDIFSKVQGLFQTLLGNTHWKIFP